MDSGTTRMIQVTRGSYACRYLQGSRVRNKATGWCMDVGRVGANEAGADQPVTAKPCVTEGGLTPDRQRFEWKTNPGSHAAGEGHGACACTCERALVRHAPTTPLLSAMTECVVHTNAWLAMLCNQALAMQALL